MPGTKLNILDLSISDLPNVFMVKAARSASQKLGVDYRKYISFHLGTKILQELIQILISLALIWFTSELGFH